MHSQQTGLSGTGTFLYDAYWPPFTPDLEYNPAVGVAKAKEAGSTAIRFGTIGKWALYPSRVMPQHPDLNGRDLLAETIRYAKQEGIKIIAYIPVGHALPAKLVSTYKPQWTARLDDGSPTPALKHFGGEDITPICSFGPYYNDIQTIVKEILRYDIDAIYLDGPYQCWDHQHLICQCQNCQKKFHQETDHKLPKNSITCSIPALSDTYINWNRNRLLALLNHIKTLAAVKNCPVFMNRSAARICGSSYEKKMLDVADGFLVECLNGGIEGFSIGQVSNKLVWNYTNQHSQWPRLNNERFEKKTYIEGCKTITWQGEPIVSYAGRFFYTDSIDNSISNLLRLNCKIKKNLQGKLEKYLCIISPADERKFEAGSLETMSINTILETCLHAMQTANIPTMILPETYLDDIKYINGFAVIWIPGKATLTPAKLAVLEEYARNGGGIITSLDTFKQNQELLFDLCQCRPATASTTQEQHFEQRQWRKQPYDMYFKCTDQLPSTFNGQLPLPRFIPLAPQNQAEILANALYQQAHQQHTFPVLCHNQYGSGRIITQGGAFEELLADDISCEIRNFYRQLIKWAANREPLVADITPNTVQASVFKTRQGDLTLALLSENDSSPTVQVTLNHRVNTPCHAHSIITGRIHEIEHDNSKTAITLQFEDHFDCLQLKQHSGEEE